MLTRPGETAMSAGAIFRPCGFTFTPWGDTEMSVCIHTPSCEASARQSATHSCDQAAITGQHCADTYACSPARSPKSLSWQALRGMNMDICNELE